MTESQRARIMDRLAIHYIANTYFAFRPDIDAYRTVTGNTDLGNEVKAKYEAMSDSELMALILGSKEEIEQH